MYQRYIILTILLLPFFLAPTSIGTRIEFNSLDSSQGPLIESRLKMEVHSSASGARALLEFTSPLTDAEILHAESLGIHFARRGSTIVSVGRIYSAYIYDVNSFAELSELGLIRATSGTKQYVPSISSSVPAIQADVVWTNLHKDGESVNGSGVTVAVLDTGAIWTHPSFWRGSSHEYKTISSGPNYYIDLNNNSMPDPPAEGPIRAFYDSSVGPDFSYSSDYMYINVDGNPGFSYASGDRWIGGVDANDDNVITLGVENAVLLNESKIAILYDQANADVYVRGVNLTQAVSVGDEYGHGTHVASTIAGGQIGMTSFVGVAPGADLIIIKSELLSADILDGISFAIENDADIINMSFSSYLGFLDGTDIEDLAVSEAFLRHGVLTTAAAGNLGNKNKHARFSAAPGSSGTALMDVDNVLISRAPFLSLLWHSSNNDEHVILTPPSGNSIDLGAFSSIAGQSWAHEDSNLRAYIFADVSIRGINNVIIQASADDHMWVNGVWNVTVTNDSGELVWIDAFAWDGRWETTQLTFQTARDSERTISSPATADFAVAVAAYSEGSSTIMVESSRGPRVDGSPKPAVAAPGDNIIAASTLAYDLWTPKDGTSMASPHVAGVLALIRQASGQNSAWLDYSVLVNGAGGKTNHYEYPSTSWGHGLVDALWSVTQVLDSPGVDNATYSDWFGVDELFGDSIDPTVSGGLDITSVKSFLDNDSLALAITMRDTPDFQGTNILSIDWDTDSNAGTGINGADIVVNVTGGSAEVYDWNGTAYISSSLVADWWTDFASVILRVEGILLGTRGIISVRTHNSTMSNVDMAGSGTLTDMLLPVMKNLWLEFNDGSMMIHVYTNDRDTPKNLQTTAWSVVNGPLEKLNSSSVLGEREFIITVPEELIGTTSLNSISSNITSESYVLYLPLILLSTQIGPQLAFTSAILDRTVIRVGFLMNDLISGELVLAGYNLASRVYVAFHSEVGPWLNFTLTSSTGVYEFEITPSHFQLGNHEVFAIAIGQVVPGTESNFATLTIVQDNTVIIVGAAIIITGCVFLLIMRRRRGEVS